MDLNTSNVTVNPKKGQPYTMVQYYLNTSNVTVNLKRIIVIAPSFAFKYI